MKRRKEFHLFPLGILFFTLTLTIVSGRIAIHAADLNTELPANDSTEISSEIPTETPVVPSTENPKPVLQGLIHDKNGHFYFYQNGKKLKNRWKKVGKNKYYFGKNGQAVTGKKNISHYLCYFNKKGVLTRKIDKNKKMVALTYDDGPSVYTPTILKTLKKNDSVATFFVVGSRVPAYSKTVQKAYDNGCQIGNHTYDHKILTRIGKKEVQKQVSKTNRAVKKVIGINPVVMRPPGGATSSNIKSWVGMPSIIWSIDTLDWKTRDSASTQKAVLNHVKDGDIVLMHDLYKATATASQTIIPELTRRGYQLVTVSELAECRGDMKQTGTYFKFPKEQK